MTSTQPVAVRRQLPPEKKLLQEAKASCAMRIHFKDGNVITKWSNEWAQPHKFHNINDAVGEFFRLFEKYWRGKVIRVGMFDMREHDRMGAHNKIYQFEDGYWKPVQPFTW